MLRKITLFLISILTSSSAFSQISWVTSLEDDTIAGTLRYAINHASIGADIRFSDTLFTMGPDTLSLDSTIYITEAISIRGYMRNGDTLYISGGSSTKIFDIDLSYTSASNGNLVIDSMALIDGSSTIGGAMQLHFIGATDITNCYFKNNSSTYGGGVIDCDLVSTTNFLAHLKFENNTLVQNAGPALIRISDVEQIQMDHIYINHNNSEKAIQASANRKLVATNFYVTDNYKVNPSGANMLLSFGADTLLTDSLLVMNNTEAGAFSFGGFYQHHKNLYAINNTQQYGAGALDMYWYYNGVEPPLFENCVFKYNTAGNAGAIRATSLTMKNSIIRGNTTTDAMYGSGAIACEYSAHEPLSFIDCVIDSNVTTQGLGGAIYGETEHLYLERVSIYQNDGGIYGGGVVLTDCDTLTILNSYVGDNTADENAGIHLPHFSTARILNTTICNNTATQGTGGLNSFGSLEISGTLILNNLPVNFGTSGSLPTFVSNGYNLIAQNLPLAGFQQTDIINAPTSVTPMSMLSDNGGIGLTRMPLAGNIAINQGNPSDSSRSFNDTILDGRRDIGAVENNDSILQSFTTLDICDSTFIGQNWVMQSGFYIDSIKSAQNTDSIAIIKINNVHHSSHVVDTQSSCDSIVWIDGQTYYTDNHTASVILTSQHGCDSIVTLDFTKTKLDTSLIVTASYIQLNLTTALVQWYECDSTFQLIPNATSPVFTSASKGNYLAILEKDGCVDTTRCIYFSSDLSLQRRSTLERIKVFPNPTSGVTSISWTSGKTPEKIRIYSMHGQLLKEIMITPNQPSVKVRLDNLSHGPHLLMVEDREGAFGKAIIIKN